MKYILTFISGAITGVIGAYLWGKPAKPSETDYDKLAENLGDALWKAHTTALGKALEEVQQPDNFDYMEITYGAPTTPKESE